MKKTQMNPMNKTTSLRVLADIQSEKAYLEQHPELNNVFTFHRWKELSRSALYFDRFGRFCLCYPTYSTCYGVWRLVKYHNTLSPALKKKGIKKTYSRATYRLNGVRCDIDVHKIIADMFVDHLDMFANEIDHIDEDICNNSHDNLEFVTHEENIRRRFYNYYTRKGRPVPAKFLPQ